MTEHSLPAEGWYRDPFGGHEARWFSAGVPTPLVRDGEVDSQDPPPASAGSQAIVPEELPEVAVTGDLRRADAAERRSSLREETPWEVVFESANEAPPD
ncbi:MAG TPA: hypothetical protein VEH29_05060 [Acidimicrobiales bacterium]|nr:hypothetical protein [Acidimicrobiales bacterium]